MNLDFGVPSLNKLDAMFKKAEEDSLNERRQKYVFKLYDFFQDSLRNMISGKSQSTCWFGEFLPKDCQDITDEFFKQLKDKNWKIVIPTNDTLGFMLKRPQETIVE